MKLIVSPQKSREHSPKDALGTANFQSNTKPARIVKYIWLFNLNLLFILLIISGLIFFSQGKTHRGFLFNPPTNTVNSGSSTLFYPTYTYTPALQKEIPHQPVLALSPIASKSPSVNLPLSPTATLTAIPTATLPLIARQEPAIIGLSTRGKPLEVYQFGTGPIHRVIIAGIHGGYESNTVELADELIEYLSKNSQIIPAQITLFILRNLNPDGFERSLGVAGRANANNVDLNRNWDALWASDWPPSGCWNSLHLTAGPYPMSEPETIALAGFISTHSIDALINYHSASLGIFPGGQPPDKQSLNLAQEIASVSPYPYPPVDTGCAYTGQLIDWASQRGIAAVDIELSNHQDTELKINLKILSAFLNWNIASDIPDKKP